MHDKQNDQRRQHRPGGLRRWCARLAWPAVAAGALTATGLAASGVPSARAATVPPKPTTLESYYVQVSPDMDSAAVNDGCDDGLQAANTAASEREAVTVSAFLDFGAQTGNGTETLTPRMQDDLLTESDIQRISEEFADSFALCGDLLEIPSHPANLALFLGTNTSGKTPTYALGKTWGNSIVAPVESYVESHDSGLVGVNGANDIETEFSSFGHAQAWVTGFGASSGGTMLDYGDAGGCPFTSGPPPTCNNGWTQADVVKVSWSDLKAVPAPEIYSDASSSLNNFTDPNAKQWELLCNLAASEPTSVNPFGAILFWGPLDQAPLDPKDVDGSGNTSVQSWTDLWNDLNGSSAATSCHQTPLFSLEQNAFPVS